MTEDSNLNAAKAERRKKYGPTTRDIIATKDLTLSEAAEKLHTYPKKIRDLRRLCGIETKYVATPRGLRPVWTEEEDEILRTCSVKEAVKLLNRSKAAIRTRRCILGVKRPVLPAPHLPRDQYELIVRMAALHYGSSKELALKHGIRVRTLQDAAAERRNELNTKGKRRPWTAAEDEEVRGSKRAYAVARRLGRSIAAVKMRRRRLKRGTVEVPGAES
jgi:DNA-binding CsgD family transcriptional regulator